MSKEYVLEVHNLNKTYGKKRVLNNVSLNVKHNEIVGFIGPNGAGKSTTMKCICNLIYPDSGEVIINGHDLFKNREKALESQAALIESPGLYQDMTGRDNIELIANLRGIGKERVEEICKFTELREALDRKVSGYSMGMKQRLGLGIAILSKPKFLILDEPTNGLDPTGVIKLRSTLQNLVNEEDISILFSSHQLGEVEKLAHRIIFINEGEIVEVPEIMSNIQKYIMQISDLEPTVEILVNILGDEVVEIISPDSVRFEVQNQDILSEILFQILSKKIKVHDIYKDNIDIETIYEEIFSEA
ncbi:MAG: ABC transporter ATP-binding protein [Tissierellia bacterium]|nr:ABC transporter ATP-binding protein [Tissierellia bacterium]